MKKIFIETVYLHKKLTAWVSSSKMSIFLESSVCRMKIKPWDTCQNMTCVF